MIVEAFPPIDTTGNIQTGNAVHVGNSSHVIVKISTGLWAGGNAAVTLQQGTAQAMGDAKTLAFSFMYTNDGAPTASLLTKTAVSGDTFNVDTALSMYVIEIPIDTLDVDGGFDYLRVVTASPGANADLIQADYYLSGNRFHGDTTPLT